MKKIGLKSRRKKRTLLVLACALFFSATLAVAGSGYLSVRHSIDQRMEQLLSSRSSRFFALYPPLHTHEVLTLAQLRSRLADQGYEEVRSAGDLLPLQYAWVKNGATQQLLFYRPSFEGAGHKLGRLLVRVDLGQEQDRYVIEQMVRVDTNQPLDSVESLPKRIGAYYAGRLRTQNPVTLSDIPVSMRDAVIGIEDVHFLEHGPVSFRSTLRALLRDLKTKRFAEGGSTLTQQLMKNLFFSREKAISRKVKEAFYAFIAESNHSKEAILEAYLNEVYMGQWGTHEIHGVAEGARYYFNRPISDVTLAQSATLAAIIQAPNAHDPHRHPQAALSRRNLVLRKMRDAGLILPNEFADAVQEPLGVAPREQDQEDIGYFMDLVLRSIPANIVSRLDTDALNVYTTLNPNLESAAARALRDNLKRLTNGYASLKKKEKQGIHLQSALIAVDIPTCSVVALQGGNNYQQTQFNRVLDGKRQPGSLFKPFVYLTAFDKGIPSGRVTPLTELDGTPFEWDYDGQVWKPHNYENEYAPQVTVRKALENSINVPTARLAQMVGLPNIIDTMKKAGLTSPIPQVPSISLGSADVTPYELAQAYTTIASEGTFCPLRSVLEVYDENGNLIFGTKAEPEPRLSPIATFQTIQLMKGVLTSGTAASALSSGLDLHNFAGKTGTTNDFKDAWFVGFSPNLLALVWVGYDEDAKVGLAGSAAALPVWLEFMKDSTPFVTSDDFPVPSGVKPFDIDPATNMLATQHCPSRITEYFVPGSEPKKSCNLHP